MKTKLTLLLIALFFTVLNSSCNKDNTPNPDSTGPSGPSDPSGPKDKIIDTSIHSQNIGESYPMKIFIPKEFETNKNLTVIYLIDGLLKENDLTDITFFDKVVTYIKSVGLQQDFTAILVGIGDKQGAERDRDFKAQGCGGQEENFNNFYKFITQEVVQYVDNKYENDPKSRTLIGYSLGGGFAYNVFFRENPDNIIFKNFILVDPTLCDVKFIEKHLENLADRNFLLDTKFKIHLSQAELNVEPIYNLIAGKELPFLEMDFIIYDDETHESVIAPSIQQGLRFIYDL